MGFLKKIFKPVSKVLDKVIPNELKPLLPYAAAFAPMMLGPGIMGSGMAQRALMSGGMNIFGQLSQEGNEGDINLLSAGLGALSGAMTTPEFGTKIDSLRGLGGAPGEAPVGSGRLHERLQEVPKASRKLPEASEAPAEQTTDLHGFA